MPKFVRSPFRKLRTFADIEPFPVWTVPRVSFELSCEVFSLLSQTCGPVKCLACHSVFQKPASVSMLISRQQRVRNERG